MSTSDFAGPSSGVALAAYWLRQLGLLVACSMVSLTMGAELRAAVHGGEEYSWSGLFFLVFNLVVTAPAIAVVSLTLLDRFCARPQPFSEAAVGWVVAGCAVVAGLVGMARGFPS